MAHVECIAVFGASGKTGRAVVVAALGRGLRVRALYRPGSEPIERPGGLEVLTGQVTSRDDVRRTLAGAGAVTCVFGPRRSSKGPRPSPFCEEATANVVAAMKSLGLSRRVCQTGALAGPETSNLGLFYRRMRRRYWRGSKAVAADREAQESVVRESGLDWLLVRPPYIAGNARRGRVDAASSMRIRFLSRANVDDLAEFHCDELTNPRFHRQAVYVVSRRSYGDQRASSPVAERGNAG